MTDIQIFNSQEFGNVRTAGTIESPLFCLKDVCVALGLNPSHVRERLDDGVVSTDTIMDKLGRHQRINFINEDGLYDVILDSRKTCAKRFRKWITSEVLPSIRKTGVYGGFSVPQTKAEALRLAADLADMVEAQRDQITVQQGIISKQEPLANLGTAIMKYEGDISISEMAKILDQNGFRTGRNRFRQILKDNGYLLQNGEPSQKAMNANILAIVKTPQKDCRDYIVIHTNVVVTVDGQKYFTNKYLKDLWDK